MPFIPLEVFANNPSTTVSSGGTTAPAGGTAETWTVASSASFPAVETGATQFHVADPALPAGDHHRRQHLRRHLDGRPGARRSTTPVAHAAGFTVVQVVTAGVLDTTQYSLWQFPVQKYGAKGNGVTVENAVNITSGLNVLTRTDGGTFTAGDVGKKIVVNYAGSSAISAAVHGRSAGSPTPPRSP